MKVYEIKTVANDSVQHNFRIGFVEDMDKFLTVDADTLIRVGATKNVR